MNDMKKVINYLYAVLGQALSMAIVLFKLYLQYKRPLHNMFVIHINMNTLREGLFAFKAFQNNIIFQRFLLENYCL